MLFGFYLLYLLLDFITARPTIVFFSGFYVPYKPAFALEMIK